LIDELKLHPSIGKEKPQVFKHNLSGYWSRRINQKDSLIDKIEEEKL
jgi:toxin YoeB